MAHSANAAGFHKCPQCSRWSQCECSLSDRKVMDRYKDEMKRRAVAEKRAEEDQQDRDAEQWLRRHGRDVDMHKRPRNIDASALDRAIRKLGR